MAEDEKVLPPKSSEQLETELAKAPELRPAITRRDFLIRSNAGAVAVGMATGGIATAVAAAAQTAKPATPAKSATLPAPLSRRRVSLDIDSRKYDVDADVRESLWETMNYQLGLSNS